MSREIDRKGWDGSSFGWKKHLQRKLLSKKLFDIENAKEYIFGAEKLERHQLVIDPKAALQ